MKVTRTYTLDSEIVEQLSREDNASAVINRLLWDYYGLKEFMAQTPEKRKELKSKFKKMLQYQKELKSYGLRAD